MDKYLLRDDLETSISLGHGVSVQESHRHKCEVGTSCLQTWRPFECSEPRCSPVPCTQRLPSQGSLRPGCSVSAGEAAAFLSTLGQPWCGWPVPGPSSASAETQEDRVSGADILVGTPVLPKVHPHHQRRDLEKNTASASAQPGSQRSWMLKGSGQHPGAAKKTPQTLLYSFPNVFSQSSGDQKLKSRCQQGCTI